MAGAEIRGATFSSFLECLAELRGQASMVGVRSALPRRLQEDLERGALTRVGWYPLADFTELHAACDRVLAGGEPFAHRLGRTTMDRETRGLVRYVLVLTSPELLMRHSHRVVTTFLRGVTPRLDLLEPGRCELGLEGMAEGSPLVFSGIAGGMELLLERAGARGVTVAWRASAGRGRVVFDAQWG